MNIQKPQIRLTFAAVCFGALLAVISYFSKDGAPTNEQLQNLHCKAWDLIAPCGDRWPSPH